MSDQSNWTPTDQPAPGAPFGSQPPEQQSWAAPSAPDAAPATYGGTPSAQPNQPASPSPYAPPPAGSAYGAPPSGSPASSPYGPPPTTSPYGPPPGAGVYGGGAGSSYPTTPYPPGYGPGPYAPAYPPAPGTDGVSIAALVTGILGMGVVPLVLGIVGLNRTKKTGRSGRGFAIAGVVLGSVSIVAWIGLFALVLSPAFQEGWNQGSLLASCDRGDMAACDELYEVAEEGSEDWEFADTCGGLTDGGFSCVLIDAETYGDNEQLDALWDDCAAGDGDACEELYQVSPPDTEYEAFGGTCGGVTDGSVACTEALDPSTGG